MTLTLSIRDYTVNKVVQATHLQNGNEESITKNIMSVFSCLS